VFGGQLFAGSAEVVPQVVSHAGNATPDHVPRGCRAVPGS
jgi:hypothetical protein